MKIWLDDEKEARSSWFPENEGWVHCRWPSEVIEHLKTGKVEHLSLDHDLGEDSGYSHPRTGNDVIVWLENEVGSGNWQFDLPHITIHSLNPVGKQKMKAGIRNIHQLLEQK